MFEKPDIMNLHVSNIEASDHFYQDILGLARIENKPGWKSFKLGETILAIRPWLPETTDERKIKYGIALGFNVDDVDKRMKELTAKGVGMLIEPRDESFGRYAEIVDPDGYILMLISESKK